MMGADVWRSTRMGEAYDMQRTGIATIFGDPNAGVPVTPENGWIQLDSTAVTSQVSAGGELLLTLFWRSLQPVDDDYHVFVHLLNQSNEKIAQRDGQPVQWMRPTSTWQAGEQIVDHYGMRLPDDLPPGRYRVDVGLYDPVSGQRLPISAGPQDYAIEVGPIEVRAAR